MKSAYDIHWLGYCCLLISLITFSTIPLISWCFLLISQLLYTVLYFSSSNISSREPIANNGDANGCTILWKIENLSDYWLRNGATIRSHVFTATSLDGVKWSLHLSPVGRNADNVVTGFLKREQSHFGSDIVYVKYQITLLGKDDSVLECKPILDGVFAEDSSVSFTMDERQEKFSSTETSSFYPNLTIKCKIWKLDEEPIVSELLSARTIFKERRRSFVWKVDNFSKFRTSRMRKYVVINKLKYDRIDFKLALNEVQGSERKLDIDIRSLDKCINIFSFKVSIINSQGQRTYCGSHEYFGDDLKKGVLFTLFFVKEMLMNEKDMYLPDDVLSLDCEYVFTAVTTSNECANCGTISTLLSQEKRKMINEKHQSPSVLINDFKSLYTDAIVCDINLRTPTKTFPAHKAILSVRSSVFRRMFSSDMKENNSGCVDIADLEDDTVHQMLMYMYTESLEDLQMGNASRLYTAADKYDIPSLKQKCSFFLKKNLCAISACDVLVLADMHQDHDLKSAVLAYILENDKEIFDTQEWKKFMATNLQLAADVMFLKVSQSKILS